MKWLLSRTTLGRTSKQRGFVDPFANSLYVILTMAAILAGGETPNENYVINCLNTQDYLYKCLWKLPGYPAWCEGINNSFYQERKNSCKQLVLDELFNSVRSVFCQTQDCTGIELSEPSVTALSNAQTQCDTTPTSPAGPSFPIPVQLPPSLAHLNSLLSAAVAGDLTCPGGAPTACTGYTYSDWSPSTCPASGQQTRQQTGFLPAGCSGTPTTPMEPLTRQCTAVPSGPTTYSGNYSVQGTVKRFIDKYTCSCTLTLDGNIAATVNVAGDNTYTGTVTWSNGYGKLTGCGTTPTGFDACYDVYSGQTWTTNWPDIPAGGALPVRFGFFGAGGLCGQTTTFTATSLTDTSMSGTASMTTSVANQTLCRVENGTGQFTLQRNN